MTTKHSAHWFRRFANRIMLWEIRNATPTLIFCCAIVIVLAWQGSKLPKRLRGGLVSLPGSESEQVLHVVEKEFSKAVAFPTILVQERLGSEEELEKSWDKSLLAVRQLPAIRDVIDMHLGRKIVATVNVNTHSFGEAQEMMSSMQKKGLPEDFEVKNAKVSKDGQISAIVETDVRSFKEGEARQKAMKESLDAMHLPEGSNVELNVTRHPRRNFAMVEADVNSYQEAEALTAKLQDRLHSLDLPIGNRVRVTGLPALFYDLNKEATAALKTAEWIGLPLCFCLLIWVFGSPIAAMLPIAVALFALMMGTAIMSQVGKFVEISMFVPSVLSMIGLGVGVDYMLILLARFRECASKHATVDEGIMEAMHLAMPTLLGSGLTVTIGFSALVFTPVMLFRALGIAGVVVIFCALVCITFLAPPLFKLASYFIKWNKPIEARTPFWKRWTHFVVEHPVLCLLAGMTLIILIALPALALKTASLNPDSLPPDLESHRGYNLCKNGFGAGWLMPAVIVVEKTANQSEEEYLKAEQNFIRKLRGMPKTFDAIGGSDLIMPMTPGFSIEIPRNFFFSKSGRYHLILTMFDGNPLSLEGRDWIGQLRDMCHTGWTVGYTCNVGGVVASTLDIDTAVRTYMIRTALFCMITTFLCFAFLYRSFLIPLQAIAMNFLSVTGAYGFLVLWFQKGVGAVILPKHVAGTFGMNSVVILLLFCALFGLSMDYQVFLISRIHEEWKRSRNNKLAVRHGIELTGRVVTGAAAVMICIFLSFAFVSVLETRQFGTGMAAAILLDSTIIRLLIFPSLMLLVGGANWWWPFQKKKVTNHEVLKDLLH